MKTYEDITIEGHMRALLWGVPGSGKTALASTFPGVVFVDLDNGMKVLKGKWYRANRPKPDLVGYQSFDDEYDRYGVFKAGPQGLWKTIDFVNEISQKAEVKTITIDSITLLQVLAFHVGIEAAGKAKRSKTQQQAKGTRVVLPTQADFGAEMNIFEQFMNQFIEIPKNLVCIAHEREVTTDSGSLMRREPYLIGSSIRAQVAKWFDEVWYLDVNSKGVRTLRTQQTNIIRVNKSRTGVPDGLEDPTYQKIMEALK